jgi:hypothetical protein
MLRAKQSETMLHQTILMGRSNNEQLRKKNLTEFKSALTTEVELSW